ncbi:MAG: phage minor head protein [Pseudomonadota bacterium]
MPTPKQLYASKLKQIADRYSALEDDTIRRSLAMMQDVRRKVAAELLTAQDYRAFTLKQLQGNIDRIIAEYQMTATADLRAGFQQSFSAGIASAAEPSNALGFGVAYFAPSQAQINAVLDFSADLVKNIAEEMRGKINTQIKLGVLGERPVFDVMRNITDALGIEADASIWAKRRPLVQGVAARAETIARTEMQRVFNLASFSQQQQMAAQIPDLRKRWLATGDSRTRPTHLQAHIRYRDNPIPIAEMFEVGDARMMYPLDPNGPADETINCRCKGVLVHPNIGVIGTPLDASVMKELQRRAA